MREAHSQAFVCLYTLDLISNQEEQAIAHLCYSLGGDPSQTVDQKNFLN